MDFGRILVLSPHRDDEVLGMGGTLLQSNGPVHIHYFNNVHPDVDTRVYDNEALAVSKTLKAFTSYSAFKTVNRLDTNPIMVYITEIEKIINYFRPDSLFMPHPDYNQDHRVVYDAGLTAARTHDTNFFVKNVLLYEQPETHTPAYSTFTPHVFVPIQIYEKTKLYSLYNSQVRGHRSPEHLRAMAGFRGMQCNSAWAEAFQVVRMTI